MKYRFLLAPDSYKETMSAASVCALMKQGILRIFPDAEVVSLPLADGGEGSTACFLEAFPGGQSVSLTVKGPWFEPTKSFYGWWPEQRLAFIEMAACAGLPLAGERKNPALTTTFGVGELVNDALSRGAREILLGLGGSATHDMGCGAAAAMGVVFRDKTGHSFIPVGNTLDMIRTVDTSACAARLSGCRLTALCDIENLLLGPRGAATVFAPQKGANAAGVVLLEEKTRAFSTLMESIAGYNAGVTPGAGAAGGMGAGVQWFLGGELLPGIDTILEICRFRAQLRSDTIVITGEGRLDSQSLGGKAVSGVAKICKAAGVPLWVVAGDLEAADCLYETGVTAAFSTNHRAIPFSEAKKPPGKIRSGRLRI